MPITLPTKEALPVGPAIPLNMTGGFIPYTQLDSMEPTFWGVAPRYASKWAYPRFGNVDVTTPLNMKVRESGGDPYSSMDVNGVTDLIHGVSVTFPLGGGRGDIASGGANINFNNNKLRMVRAGMLGHYLGADDQKFSGVLAEIEIVTFPQNANTTGFISTSYDKFGGDSYAGPAPLAITTMSNNLQYELLWNVDYDNMFLDNDGYVFAPGNFDYYDFLPLAGQDPGAIRNRWQSIRYDHVGDVWECYTLIDFESSLFPVPGASGRYTMLAYNPGIIGNEFATIFEMGKAISSSGGVIDPQIVYAKIEPTPAFSCGVQTDWSSVATFTAEAGITTIADCYTPVLDGLYFPNMVIQGCPEGFLVYSYYDPFVFYIVDRDWESYQRYNVQKVNTEACAAHNSLGSGQRGIVKWVNTGVYILVIDTNTMTPYRLREGEPSGAWGGCIHEGGTGEGGGGGPGGPGGTNATPQFTASIEYGLEPAPGTYKPSPYPPPSSN